MRIQSATFDTSTAAHPPAHDSIGSDAEPGPAEASCRDLFEALRAVVDPRHRCGIRHQLVSILALAAAAVVAGARSYVAVGQWAAHTPSEVPAALEVRVHRCTGRFAVPCESTIRRTLQACDGDQIDAVLGANAGDGRAVHLLAAMLGDTRTVLAQREIPRKTNEITAFAPLLDDLASKGR